MSSTLPGLEPGIELLGVLRPYVRHCGDARRPAWRIGERCLLDYLLVYIAEGEGVFTVGAATYSAGPGDVFWIPPATPHSMEGLEPSMVCPYVHFDLQYRADRSHWDFSIPGGMKDLSGLEPLMHPPVRHPLLDSLAGRVRGFTNHRVGELVREICAEAARAQPYAGLRMSGLLLEIVGEILRGREGLSAEYSRHIPLLEEAAAFMRGHCAEKVPVPELAAMCRLSVAHFRKLFARHFGCAPRTYLRRARVRRAKQLMVGTDLDLGEIAVRSGFSSLHAFSRAFKEVEGLSPGRYRASGPPATRVEGRDARYPGVPRRIPRG